MFSMWIRFLLLTLAMLFFILAVYFNSARMAGIAGILLTALFAFELLGRK